jgi:hypothetical protein
MIAARHKACCRLPELLGRLLNCLVLVHGLTVLSLICLAAILSTVQVVGFGGSGFFAMPGVSDRW